MDMCALKRPFDDQSQGRISLETHAVLRVLSASESRSISLCNSAVLELENALNPNPARKERVGHILSSFGPARPASGAIFGRASELKDAGLKDIDALHVAFAESLKADYFITCDDKILGIAHNVSLRVKVSNPVNFVEAFNT